MSAMDPRLPLALLGALSLALAGCIGEETPTEAAAVEPPLPLAVAADVPVSWDGAFGLRAVACGPVACIGQTVVGETERLHEIEGVAGGLARINLSLSWTPAAPTADEMGFGIFSCAGECASEADVKKVEAVFGPSPLVLDLADFPLGPDEKLLLFVNSAGFVPAAYVSVSAPQDFHVEGTVTPAVADGSAAMGATA